MTDDPRPRGAVLDVDGTLLDTTYSHVDAWQRALRGHGHDVPAARIHRLIGMGSAPMVRELLGDVDDETVQTLSASHGRYHAPTLEQLHPLPGARELVHALVQRGFRVALATSAKAGEVPVMLAALDLADDVEVVDSGDVDEAKPDPGILQVAAERLGVDPGRCVMVGDAVWDVAAAERAGMPCVGLRSGGVGPSELADAGAVAVYDDPAHLLRELDRSPFASA